MKKEAWVADRKPKNVKTEAGKCYVWCACGRSADQPFCDGSHVGTGISPLNYDAKNDRMAAFCLCKKTKTPPFCDGNHINITDEDSAPPKKD